MTQAMESSSRMRIPIAASSPALLRIELVDGEKLDDRDPEVLEIGNLLGQARKRAALGWCDPGVRTRSESLDVQLIDDGVSAGVSGASLEWKRHRTLAWQTAERRSSVGRTRMGARVAAELRREEDRRRVRIEQDRSAVRARVRVVPRPDKRRAWRREARSPGCGNARRSQSCGPDAGNEIQRLVSPGPPRCSTGA
jgi:hypothetical protein